MLNVIRNSAPAKTFEYQGVKFLLVRKASEVIQQERYDGIIIDTAVTIDVQTIIKSIRLSENIESLAPLFINGAQDIDKEWLSNTDGIADLHHPETITQKTIAINKRLAQLSTPQVSKFETQVAYKTVAYIYSRNLVFSPFPTRASLIGYYFPLLSLCYNDECATLLKTLENLENKGYLAQTFKDHIHLCKNCDSTYLNFKEVCPNCKSADIQAHDMIHHFVCAHVAPEDDFKTDEGLCCPKCDKSLRHIGIDYDKPSAIFSCNSCANEFQTPEMKATCIDCNTDNALSELLQKTIGNYSVTSKGEHWLTSNEPKTQNLRLNQNSNEEKGISLPIFKILVKQEIKRIATNGVRSQLVTIMYKNDQLDHLNTTMKTVLKAEISEIINSYLTDSDILAIQSYKKYYLLLPDTTSEPEHIEHIRYNLSKLLSDNLEANQTTVTVTTKNLQPNMALSELIHP